MSNLISLREIKMDIFMSNLHSLREIKMEIFMSNLHSLREKKWTFPFPISIHNKKNK